MGFESVNKGTNADAIKLTGLKTGDTVIGFVEGFTPSLQNPDVSNIVMVSEDGSKRFYVYSAGNVKYLINDGKIKEGLLTKIVRLADKNVKGKMSSQFDVLQDSAQVLTGFTGTIGGAAGATSDRSAIAARASELASKASKGALPASATRN